MLLPSEENLAVPPITLSIVKAPANSLVCRSKPILPTLSSYSSRLLLTLRRDPAFNFVYARGYEPPMVDVELSDLIAVSYTHLTLPTKA